MLTCVASSDVSFSPEKMEGARVEPAELGLRYGDEGARCSSKFPESSFVGASDERKILEGLLFNLTCRQTGLFEALINDSYSQAT
jgi:hypothetical protein